MKTLHELDVQGKVVWVRVDFNVPMDQGNIRDATRIEKSLDTIRDLQSRGARIVLGSHLGRPKGQPQDALSLRPIAQHLASLLNTPVDFVPACRGPLVQKALEQLQDRSILLLENLRFEVGEEHPEKDPQFAQELLEGVDLYVNEAFAVSHRKHTSVYDMPGRLRSHQKALGLLFAREIDMLGTLLTSPQRPFYALLGGKKVSTKIGVVRSLIPHVDGLFLGGAMVYTFLAAMGQSIGNSFYEKDALDLAKEIIDTCQQNHVQLMLPKDLVVTDCLDPVGNIRHVLTQQGIPDGFEGVDMGPQSLEEYTQALSQAHTVLWNGPVGIFEIPPFDQGTRKIAQSLAHSPAQVIVGGGDSAAAVKQAGLEDSFTHLSTGGGAALEFVEQHTLPGLEALKQDLVQA